MREIFQYDERVMIRESRKNPTENCCNVTSKSILDENENGKLQE
jgi:hypothetical protein